MPLETRKRRRSRPWEPGGSAAQSLPQPRHDRNILFKQRILLTHVTRVPRINSLPKVWPKLGAGQGAIHQGLTGEKGVRGEDS